MRAHAIFHNRFVQVLCMGVDMQSGPVFTPEAYAQDVEELQDCLRVISRHNPSIPRVSVDGVFARDTTQAVNAFQTEYGLPPTGIVNRETWDAVVREASRLRRLSAPALPVPLFHPPRRIVKPGDTGDLPFAIQLLLRAIRRRYRNIRPVRLTGSYDGDTADAVRAFQIIAGLAPTGAVDKETWNALVGLYSDE